MLHAQYHIYMTEPKSEKIHLVPNIQFARMVGSLNDILTSTTSVPTAASSSTLGFGELYVATNTGVASLTGSTSTTTNAVPKSEPTLIAGFIDSYNCAEMIQIIRLDLNSLYMASTCAGTPTSMGIFCLIILLIKGNFG